MDTGLCDRRASNAFVWAPILLRSFSHRSTVSVYEDYGIS
ncbi:hypothetical protein GFS60_07351 (plasmid) [Rhodococcus sp. WAY2]|nr:hypothetical protein GFS60_07351 [Rhodococcus sp. WAY2]